MLPKIKTVQNFQKILLRIFIVIYLIFSLILITSSNGFSQVCESGAMFVSGLGCGCLSGCDLTPLGGPNCGGGTTGNCSVGHQTMSTTFEVPAGCDVRITAEMKIRAGCSASGADGSSTTGDRLRIRNTAGATPPWQIGGSNASLFDQMTVTGPATIIIEGAANRSDEIITYTIEDLGSCNCSQILPITLVSFFGEVFNKTTNVLKWVTSAEINNDYFTIERSVDALNFEPISTIKGAGNSNITLFYDFIDHQPQKGNNYYRLKQTDFNGDFSYSEIIVIKNEEKNIAVFYYNNLLKVSTKESVQLQILDITGRMVFENKSNNETVDLSFLSQGIYIYRIAYQNTVLSDKLVVQ